MKKQKTMGTSTMCFRDGCDAYLLYCRQRNLREATLKHYRQSYHCAVLLATTIRAQISA